MAHKFANLSRIFQKPHMKAKLNLVIFLTVLINQDFLYANEKANKSITTTISTEFLFDGDLKSDEYHDNRSELGSSDDFYELGPMINSSDRIKGGVIAEHKWPFHVMLTKYVGGGCKFFFPEVA